MRGALFPDSRSVIDMPLLFEMLMAFCPRRVSRWPRFLESSFGARVDGPAQGGNFKQHIGAYIRPHTGPTLAPHWPHTGPTLAPHWPHTRPDMVHKNSKGQFILELKCAANDNLNFRVLEDTLGGRIKTARAACHLSVAQLARRINVLSKTVRNWERDRSIPQSDNLQMLADQLDVSLMCLLGADGTFDKSLRSQSGQ